MDLLNIIRVAFRALVRNKMRAALTMLGIIIGVSAVVAMVTPAVNARGQLVAGNMNWNTSIQGVSEQYPDVRKWSVQSGEFFTDADVRTAARVLVIGQTIADNLFAGMDPVGQTIRVQNLPFRVAGVMVRKGQDAQGRDQDDVAFSPYTTV